MNIIVSLRYSKKKRNKNLFYGIKYQEFHKPLIDLKYNDF